MEQFLMKPKVDFAFKEIMTDEKARTGFLAVVLKINSEDIKETQILNTNLPREHEDDKQGILDVRLLIERRCRDRHRNTSVAVKSVGGTVVI